MYIKKTLPNGVRIRAEHIDTVRSVSFGIWIGNGSRYEPLSLAGISHFIEHMIFKGTTSRTAQQLAIAMDEIGGQVNAFTTKECTCYYFKTLDTYLLRGAEILADMLLHSTFTAQDIALERGVVLEEIDMYEDTPEDVATEKLFENCFAGSALARPILGTKESLAGMDSQALHDYVHTQYHPSEIVIALCGSFTQSMLEEICTLFSAIEGSGQHTLAPTVYQPTITVRKKEIEQCHLCMGFAGLSMHDEDRYAMQMLSAILGDGMSSRLFQSVREKNGLCYSIYSYHESHHDVGLFQIYTALGKPMEARALSLICQVIESFCDKGPTEAELNRCREQRKTSMLMGLESTSARMNHLGRSELFRNCIPQPEELITAYDAVTVAQVRALAQRIFDFSRVSLCAVGQVDQSQAYAKLIGRTDAC